MPKGIIVFDFDWSLINENSDTFIIKQCNEALWAQRKALYEAFPEWTDFMHEILKRLHDTGFKDSDIKEQMVSIPFEAKMIELVKNLHANDYALYILSDANQVFIRWILESHNIYDKFERIVTNPAHIDAQGRIHVLPYHNRKAQSDALLLSKEDDLSHNCELCPSNLCKGKVLEKWQKQNPDIPFMYIGDGSGDYCPTLRLNTQDTAYVRKDYSLHQKIVENEGAVLCAWHIWEDAQSLYKLVAKKASLEANAERLSI